MPDKPAEPAVAQQIELAVRQLDSLPTLPCVAARFLSKLVQTQVSASALAEIIESDPALTVKMFSLVHEQGLSFAEASFSVRRAVEKLPAHLVRDAVFSVKVAGELENNTALSKKELILHSLAVACCAKMIAEAISPKMNSQLAYSAGLLHNIGNLALHQVMPKSLARMVEEAKSENASICAIQQRHVGLDYTILGKRLAQKWHLPNEIILAIWLHHSDTAAIVENMPEARIAQVIRSADSIAHRCRIGCSGSYDLPDSINKIAKGLGIDVERLEQIRGELPEQAAQKSQVLGFNLLRPEAAYRDALHNAAAQLARDNSKLSVDNRQLQSASSHFDFMREFLLSIDSNSSPIDIAANFAVRWQKFYQTGMVCAYLVPSVGSQSLEAVIVETLGQTKTVILNAPAETPAIPRTIAGNFAIVNAHDHISWLFEQLEVHFELSSIAGSVLDLAFSSAERQRFAEQFAGLLSNAKDAQRQSAVETPAKETPPPRTENDPVTALAEMAAGAAHELNNPLSVISGRAQLLAGAETDSEKKRILEQIQENANELSAILDDVLAFARPEESQPRQTNIRQMLDEAIQLASIKMNTGHINAQIEVAENAKSVFVDSGQVVSALANVICNSVESYTGQMGPVKISACSDESGDIVELQISDLGCGMDAETVRKATWPFFCSRPAGRKRGMGLAHAVRLIQLNNGSLDIASEPGKGTMVTIHLPANE
jgi:putative nucleotidyltransferase with HDIG domain